jgi:hypothetical protein
MNAAAQLELWRNRFRFCEDVPVELTHEQAQFILREHDGHGDYCRQRHAALARVSVRLG